MIAIICPIVIIADLGFFKLSLPPLSLRWSKRARVAGSDGESGTLPGPGMGPHLPLGPAWDIWPSQILLIPSSLTPGVINHLGFKSAGSNF